MQVAVRRAKIGHAAARHVLGVAWIDRHRHVEDFRIRGFFEFFKVLVLCFISRTLFIGEL